MVKEDLKKAYDDFRKLQSSAKKIIKFNKEQEGFRQTIPVGRSESRENKKLFDEMKELGQYFEKNDKKSMAERAYKLAKDLAYTSGVRDGWSENSFEYDFNEMGKEAKAMHAYRLGRIEGYRKHKGLASKIITTFFAIPLIVGLFFLSANFTGNVIGSLNQTSSNWIGGVLFLIGLVGAFAYFRKR